MHGFCSLSCCPSHRSPWRDHDLVLSLIKERVQLPGDAGMANRSNQYFVRAGAVETHVKISQEPLIQKFTRKMVRPRMSPERGGTLCASLRTLILSLLFGSSGDHCDHELAVEVWRGRRRRRRRRTADIKSNNHHLTGGEQEYLAAHAA